MIRTLTLAIAAAAVITCGCTTTRNDLPQSSIRLIYVTKGGEALGLVRAFDDGERTTLQFNINPPKDLQVLDANGVPITYERLGQYLALHGLHGRMLVTLADVRAEIHIPEWDAELIEQANVVLRAKLDLPRVAPAPAVIPVIRRQSPELRGAHLALQLAERQLADLRGLAAVSPRDGADALSRKLDRIEKTVADAAAVILRVEFGFNSIDFAPRPEVAQALVAAATKAERITVRSYTDSPTVDDANRKVALARAIAARQYLIERGVEPQRIRAFYNSAGGFIADNSTADGRAQNRRVEVEIQSRRIARLASAATDLSTSLE